MILVIFIKSCEKGLVNKECIVTHTHLKTILKWALHFSPLAKTCVNSGTKLFQAAINTTTL